LEYLKERETSLNEFLQKAGGQLTGIEESISFTRKQLGEEEDSLEGLNEKLLQLQAEVNAKRNVLDEKRSALDELRSEYQRMQREQFEAEKKVAVADTSIQNVQRAIQQIEQERATREEQRESLAARLVEQEKELQDSHCCRSLRCRPTRTTASVLSTPRAA
jgi:chromosome segregation protein